MIVSLGMGAIIIALTGIGLVALGQPALPVYGACTAAGLLLAVFLFVITREPSNE